MTASAGSVFTAAQFNTHVRDNLNETAPAKATAAGQLFVATGANAIAARTVSNTAIATLETTASTTYANLATVGPAVTATTGTAALVFLGSAAENGTAAQFAYASCDVTGATTVAASDDWAVKQEDNVAAFGIRASSAHLFTGLTGGSNVFTMKYRVTGGTGSFQSRELIVIPL